MRFVSLSVVSLFALIACSPVKKAEKSLFEISKELSSEKYKGRETGTRDELNAAYYIMLQMKLAGLSPAGRNDNYFQAFPFSIKPVLRETNQLIVNHTAYKPGTEYFPLSFSASGTVEGKAVHVNYDIRQKEENDTLNPDGKIAIINTGLAKGIGENKSEYLKNKALDAQENGAIAVIFIASEPGSLIPEPELTGYSDTLNIPVIYARGMPLKQFLDASEWSVKLQTNILREERIGYNVFGKIDNNAERTVLLGAHYDHIGLGGENSLYRGDDTLVHNGADDNASGVAMILTLSHELKKNPYRNFNYIIAAFSGEEKGLLGSKWALENPTFDTARVSFMLNFDMVGRLDSSGKLFINGTGTSDAWNQIFEDLDTGELSIILNNEGTGLSDHASFYFKQIPALHFFTGIHNDYHRPTDDFEKLNLAGMRAVYTLILNLLKDASKVNSFNFTETSSIAPLSPSEFKVILGNSTGINRHNVKVYTPVEIDGSGDLRKY